MKKSIFKKILTILDAIETSGVSIDSALPMIQKKLDQENIKTETNEVTELLRRMNELRFFRHVPCGIDLSPSATIMSRSDPSTEVEALALLECLIRNNAYRNRFRELIKTNPYLNDEQLALVLPDPFFFKLMKETVLYEVKQNTYRINPLLLSDTAHIIMEYDELHPLVSTTLCALYTADIVNHEDQSIPYRNTDMEMIDYPYKKIITDIIPRTGIPCEREETKTLQTFYKDTLFHEFEHCCPLCGIDLPHMLIASHIKPFRDCAHIYECSDYHNGLLLCRNHDYLFDQGYISFQDDGVIMISEELAKKENLESAYMIHTDDILQKAYLNETRRMFLDYHRSHIFKK